MAILSAADRAFFDENGYIKVEGLVPEAKCAAVVDAIFDFLGMDPNDPSDWYREPHRTSGFVELYHHPAMWEVRQHPGVYEVFSELWDRPDLWVSLDRVGFKPPPHPDHPDYDHPGFVHWDADTANWPLPFSLQGVLYLTDTSEEQGGWQGIAGFHRDFDEWVKTQPADRDTRNPDLTGLEVTHVAGKAGDMIIWTRSLAHGNGHNVTDQPRFAQYITMSPARPDDEEALAARLEAFRLRRPPQSTAFVGDDRGYEERMPDPQLTDLGQKLLGSEPW
jgi:hypothetical protein